MTAYAADDGPRARAHSHDAHDGDLGSRLGIHESKAREFFHWWRQFSEEIDSANASKAAMVKNLRAIYGPYHSEALRRACNTSLKEPGKVAKDDAIAKAARACLAVLKDTP